MKVQGKVIVVTGGGNGIGRALVLELIARGASVAAVDLRPEALAETEQAIPTADRSRYSAHVADITDRERVAALPQEVIAAHGAVDGLINNAGIIQPFVRVAELDYADIERVVNVNLYGTLHLVKAFLPHLQARPTAHILNVSSMGGFLPVPGQALYGAAKAGVKLLSEALYAELKGTHVGVTVAFPGAIGTNITANSGVATPSMGDAQESKFKPMPAEKAAAQIVKAMERNRLRVYVGQDAQMLNLLYRLHPTFATDFIAKQMKALLG